MCLLASFSAINPGLSQMESFVSCTGWSGLVRFECRNPVRPTVAQVVSLAPETEV